MADESSSQARYAPAMPAPPEIVLVPFSRGEALAAWREHRDRFESTGLWPLIVSDEAVEWLPESVREAAEEGLPDEEGTDAEAMFADILRERRAHEEREGPDLAFDPSDLAPMDWPPLEEMAPEGSRLALVPCDAPWQAPAILGNPGSDLWPSVEDLVAALREWHARHGAEPLGFGSGMLTLVVRPIEDPAEAKRIAVQQYALCEDMGNAGEASIRELAAGLLRAPLWTFWWD